MSIHNVCFHSEIRKHQYFSVVKSSLFGAMINGVEVLLVSSQFHLNIYISKSGLNMPNTELHRF